MLQILDSFIFMKLLNASSFGCTGFYLEDGVEEKNRFEYNLGSGVWGIANNAAGVVDFTDRCCGDSSQNGIQITTNSYVHIPADSAACSFYNTNPNNEYYGNSASGGFCGFSFVRLAYPIGSNKNLAEYSNFSPQNRPLKQFYGNTAHSSSSRWYEAGCIYSGGNLYYKSDSDKNNEILTYRVGRSRESSFGFPLGRNTNIDGTPSWMTFEHTKTFMCQKGLQHWGNYADIKYFESHDSQRGATTFGESSMSHAILNMKTSNPTDNRPRDHQLFQFYDISVKTILAHVNFRNIQEADCVPSWVKDEDPNYHNYALVSLTHSDYFKPQGISATTDISFTNSDNRLRIGHYVRPTGASRQ